MKRIISQSLAACLCASLLGACSKQAEPAAQAKTEGDNKEQKAPPPYSVERDAQGNAILSVNAETQKAIGLAIAPVEAGTKPAETPAYGLIIDPAPLLTLENDLLLNAATLAASEMSFERAQTLFRDNENVPRKTLEAAETDKRSSQLKLQASRQAIQLTWGDAIANLSPEDSQKLSDDVVKHRVAFARVDLPAGETLSNTPSAARLALATSDHWIEAGVVSPAITADPKTLGQGFILKVEKPELGLVPGAALKAELQTAAPPVQGLVVPDSAVVRFEARVWVYLAGETNKFERREISLDTQMTNGWFVNGGLSAGDKIVVEGGQILLSEEQKSQFAGGGD